MSFQSLGRRAEATLHRWIFFLSGYVKDMIYRTKGRDIIDLQHRITEAATAVAVHANTLARTRQEITN